MLDEANATDVKRLEPMAVAVVVEAEVVVEGVVAARMAEVEVVIGIVAIERIQTEDQDHIKIMKRVKRRPHNSHPPSYGNVSRTSPRVT